jgi:hypothetical protein
MDAAAELPQPDPDFIRRQRDLYYQVVHNLYGMLPGPRDETHAEFDRRIRVAIDRVAAMLPVNADEASIAVHCVAAGAHADDCFSEAVANVSHPLAMSRLLKQATSMMRAESGQRSLLLRVQAARHKREATNKTRDQDAWSEHAALGWMTRALQEQYAPPPAAAKPATDPAPAAQPSLAVARKPQQPAAAYQHMPDTTRTPARPASRDDLDPRDAAMLRMLERVRGDGGVDRHGAAFLEPVLDGAAPPARATG